MASRYDPVVAPRQDAELMMRYDSGKRSTLIAYLIWFFLGWAGIHRLYLGRITSGLLMMALLGVSWLLHFVVIGFLGYLIIIPWWLIDAILIPGLTSRYNERLIESLSRRY